MALAALKQGGDFCHPEEFRLFRRFRCLIHVGLVIVSFIISVSFVASVIPKLSVFCQPRQVVKSPCGPASMSNTFLPCIARPTPRFTVAVVFPAPPF